MSSPRFEAFLARLYSDPEFLSHFMRAPAEVSREAGLDLREQAAAVAIDRAGLLMAARSYELKRGLCRGRPHWGFPRWPLGRRRWWLRWGIR